MGNAGGENRDVGRPAEAARQYGRGCALVKPGDPSVLASATGDVGIGNEQWRGGGVREEIKSPSGSDEAPSHLDGLSKLRGQRNVAEAGKGVRYQQRHKIIGDNGRAALMAKISFRKRIW